MSMRSPSIDDDDLVEDVEVFRLRSIYKKKVSSIFDVDASKGKKKGENEPFHCIESSTAIIGNIVAMNQLGSE